MRKYIKNINFHTKIYIALVVLIFSIVYLPILLNGKMYIYIDIGADTYCGIWPGLVYGKNLLADFKLWDMQLGLGASTSHYISTYLCDPFNWICFLFSKENVDIGIFIGVMLKTFCLAIGAWRYVGIKNLNGYTRIISALMIVFCGWVVGFGQHYGFATVFVYFVMMLFYFERWRNNEEITGLVITVMALAAVSAYHCYMCLLFLVFYYFISLYYEHNNGEKVKFLELLPKAIKTALVILLGLGCSAFSFFPYAWDVLSSPRVSGTQLTSLALGNIEEYRTMILRLFSNSILGINENFAGYANFYESPFMYVSILAVVLIPIFLSDKLLRKKYMVSILGILFTFVFVNFSAPIFNAFSAKTYRWTFCFVPIIAIACGKTLDRLKLSKRLAVVETLCFNSILIAWIVWYGRKYSYNRVMLESAIVAIVIVNIYIFVLLGFHNKEKMKKMLLLVITADLCINAYITVNERSLISQSEKKAMGYFDCSNEALAYLEDNDDSFYRVSKNYNLIDLNDSMIQGYNGEKFYSSVLSAATWDMMSLFDLRIPNSNYLYGFEEKQALRDITVGKYRLAKAENEYFGYDFLTKTGDVNIYQNENCLEFGVLYDNYVLRSDVESFDLYKRQNAVLDACIIEDNEWDADIEKLNQADEKIGEISMELLSEEDNIEKSGCVISIENNIEPLVLKIGGQNSTGNIQIYSKRIQIMRVKL